jgi:cell wall-associated NlpC family hydrolase
VSAHLRPALPKYALTWAFIALMSVLGVVEAPSAAHAATPAARTVAVPPAQPGTATSSSVSSAAKPLSASRLVQIRGIRIVAAAGAQRGKPYRRGAQGPTAFDCSGLTGYAYRAAHIRLPRTANDQYHAARRIGRAAARPGDLVFWVSGKHAYHVAVYAGSGRVWHAPKPGDRVRLAKIFSPGQTRFGRVGA